MEWSRSESEVPMDHKGLCGDRQNKDTEKRAIKETSLTGKRLSVSFLSLLLI